MKAQHTPALWRIEINDTGFRITHSDSGLRSHVATLHEAALCEEHGDTFANANLIAAAPDLLEALTTIMGNLKAMGYSVANESMAFAAIAKAKGGVE
jgi:hypothetical protein